MPVRPVQALVIGLVAGLRLLCPTAAHAADVAPAPPLVKLWLNAGVRINPSTARVAARWHLHVLLPDIVQPRGRAPWLYTGPSWQVSDKFNIELLGGMGTGLGDEARGVAPLAGAWFTWTPPRGWLVWSGAEWWGIARDPSLFGVAIVSKQIRASPVALGVETWGILPLGAPERTTLLGGPNLGLKLGDRFNVRAVLLMQGTLTDPDWAVGPAVFLNCNL